MTGAARSPFHRLKILMREGTAGVSPHNMQLYLDGKEIRGIVNLKITANPHEPVKAEITLYAEVETDIDAEVASGQFLVPEESAFRKEHVK